ncbi:glutathione S-transferase family protein [Methylobacterium nonmethylotrophicum]|uniref:Glutathione S-transferase family protein n=1 Tax=Methylobacterium nonmethylotrophicum TaxID=1141884 RepID=A0A4Z0NV68_9HYPH|nr:glutathione S-transferase family protein [Methylobacterium nonmethylotrophicum]TGE00824.1 glutathione S-transferase family protein [Methylobacterium nonmethylotrophicum]
MSAHAIILHHYPFSPYAEKVRLALGLKGLDWGSVEVAVMPPRPLLDPLTGGYRRIPVLQVGADIYCDTNAILPALERLHPEPSLYPGLNSGLAKALSFGLERDLWLAVIGVLVHHMGDLPEAFLRDRKDDYLYVDISRGAMEPDFARNAQRVGAWIAWLAEALADGRGFLGGDRAGAVDLAHYHLLSLMRSVADPAPVDRLLGLAPILGWYARVKGLGHGRPHALTAEEALAAARAAEPAPIDSANAVPDLIGIAPGEPVTVTPDDFARVPVQGRLVAIEAGRIVIRRDDPDLGALHLHFPRAGFVVAAG